MANFIFCTYGEEGHLHMTLAVPKALKRAGMDYAEVASIRRHADWDSFAASRNGRLVLLTTQGGTRLDETMFTPGDTLLLGSESHGAPPEAHHLASLRVSIPQVEGTRSLNIAVAAGIGEHEPVIANQGILKVPDGAAVAIAEAALSSRSPARGK